MIDDLGLTRARLIGLVLLTCLTPTLAAVLLGAGWPVGGGVAIAAIWGMVGFFK